MSNALLAWANAVYSGLNVYAGGWAATATVAHLATPNLSEKWNSGSLGTTSTRLFFGLPGNPTLSVLGLANHNMTLAATIRVMGSNDIAFGSMAYDSGTINVWPGGVTEGSRAGARWTWWHRFPTPQQLTYWRIQINDGANPAGFVTAGRLLAMQGAWMPTVNIARPAGVGFEPGSEVITALNGAEWFVEREAARFVRFRLQVPTTEALDNAYELLRVASGPARDVLFVWDPAEGKQQPRRTLFGRLRQTSPLEDLEVDALALSLELKESL